MPHSPTPQDTPPANASNPCAAPSDPLDISCETKKNRVHFFDFTPDTLKDFITQLGLKPFRAKQIMQWVYEKNVIDPLKMSNLSQADQQTLIAHMDFLIGHTIAHQRASDGVQKLLIDWAAHKAPLPGASDLTVLQSSSENQTECVLIPTEKRNTACISSQVGCAVGCTFCASGIGGLDGNLTAGQIIQQVWQLNHLPEVERISNIVFMGMGEPLSNFTQVVHAIKTLNAPWGMGISARKITISTVGLPAQIRRLAEIELQVTLAISLHAPDDQLRRELIPWAEYVTIEQLFDAAAYYFEKTGREITLEYILLGQTNDQTQHAQALGRLAKSIRANINLIRYNRVEGLPYRRPKTEDVLSFQKVLQSAGITTHIRASRGRDIAAACGQLRHEHSS